MSIHDALMNCFSSGSSLGSAASQVGHYLDTNKNVLTDLDKAKLALALLESITTPKVLSEGTREWEIDHAKRLLQGALDD